MKLLRVPILFAAGLCITTDSAAADAALTLRATESSAQLLRREPGPQHVSLPPLEFSLLATIACASGTRAESVMVSISDTHKRFGPDDIGDKAALDVRVSVPANQIAPVTVADFCITGGPDDEMGLLIPGIATAQVSLRCRSDNDSFVYFESAVLPVRIQCDSDENQEASTDR